MPGHFSPLCSQRYVSRRVARRFLRRPPSQYPYPRSARQLLPGLAEADVQGLIQTLPDNPLLHPGDLARMERQNALELFPSLRPSAAVHGLQARTLLA